ncbi:TPA: hypothetical protein DCZ16_04115 [Candidatus Peregrinibacteria bacterium]|nr:hypothetical protein [Candidatus Peregrinibacteria bacterium]
MISSIIKSKNLNTIPMDQNLKQVVMDIPKTIGGLFALLSDKEKIVIQKRFNLDHVKLRTLEEIGKDFSVTRERVRQIEQTAIAKLSRNVFNTPLPMIHQFAITMLQANGGVMREDIFISSILSTILQGENADVEALKLSLLLDKGIDREGNKILSYPYFRLKTIETSLVSESLNVAVDLLDKKGKVMDLETLYKGMKDKMKNEAFTDAFLNSALRIDKRIKIAEAGIGLIKWRDINPRTLKDKIFFILRKNESPLHFRDITSTIIKEKFDHKPVNLQAVHNELIRWEDFILIGRGIYALKEWGYSKGTVKDIITTLLSKKKEMDRDDIIKEVLKQRQVKKITILLSLSNNKEFKRVGRRVYTLVK